MLGCGLGIYARSWEVEVWRLVVPCVVGCLLYLGGCLLNDWWDRKWDSEKKPNRPLPSGRVSGGSVLVSSAICLLGGMAVSAYLSSSAFFVAVGIAVLISVYTAIHKKTAWGVLPMGLCRGFLYLLGFLSQVRTSDESDELGVNQQSVLVDEMIQTMDAVSVMVQATQVAPLVIGMLCFVAGLSLFARAETECIVPRANVVCGIGLMALVIFTHSVNWMRHLPVWNLISLIPFVGVLVWGILRTRKDVGERVSWLLATIALVDFVVALPLGIALWQEGFVWGVKEGLVFPTVSIFAFGLALVLQRVAPAT
ncbi:MAG: UbiA family prenyltransferase [Verrucomicrobiota bacterium]